MANEYVRTYWLSSAAIEQLGQRLNSSTCLVMCFRVFVTNCPDTALEIWRDYNGRAAMECRIDELNNKLAADHFRLRSFFAKKSAFLAVLFSFNLLSEFQRAIDPALKTYKQPATLRFELFTSDRNRFNLQRLLHER